jgi:uncharacterized protein (TIGR04255 family)
MARQRHLARAPIREAIINIQIAPPVELSSIKEFAGTLKNEFAKTTDIWQASFGVQFDQDNAGATTTNRFPIGKRMDSADAREVMQCSINAFSFSRLAPYEDWSHIRDSAKRLWALYVLSVKPKSITRVAVRYVNALPIPLPVPELNDYFTAAPQVPSALPQMMRSFLQQVTLVDEATNSLAAVVQASEGITAPNLVKNEVTVLIDIDASQIVDIGPLQSDAIWQKFEELRDFKNRIFFELITERTARLFE